MSIKQLSAARLLTKRCSVSQVEKYIDARHINPSKNTDYISPNNVKVSAVQMCVTEDMDFHEYIQLVCDIMDKAVENGSQLVVFPEYVGLMPLTSSKTLFEMGNHLCDNVLGEQQDDIDKATTFFEKHLAEPLFESYYNLFSLLSSLYRVYIQAGSTIVKTREGLFNRAYLFGPNGKAVGEQNKLHLSRQERLLGVKPGLDMEAFETKLGKVSILIGKDQRVFEAAKAARQHGSGILLCPASFNFSEGEIFYQSGAFMRCQEQQMYAVCSWMTGDIFGLQFRGMSGIYSPYEISKLGNGISTEVDSTKADACLTARIDLERLGREINLYTSDHNPVIDQLLDMEYARPRTSRPVQLTVVQGGLAEEDPENQDEEGETGELVKPGQ